MVAALGGAVEQERSRLMCMLEHLLHETSAGWVFAVFFRRGVDKILRLSEEVGVKMLPGSTICGFGH